MLTYAEEETDVQGTVTGVSPSTGQLHSDSTTKKERERHTVDTSCDGLNERGDETMRKDRRKQETHMK